MPGSRTALMTEGTPWKRIIMFAVPIFIGYLFQQLYNTVDSLIVGNFIGPTALAAVTSTGSVTYLLVGFFLGFSSGAGIVIAQALGRGDIKGVVKAVHTDVAMGLCFSVMMTAIGVFGCETILTWMGTPKEVLPESVKYLRVYFAGSTGLILYNTFTGILQASGDSRHPLLYLICSSVLNLVLDLLFIAVFGMGVDGAALATAISQVTSASLALTLLLRTDSSIRVMPRRIRFDLPSLRQIVRFGFPTALQGSVIDLSNVLIQSYINSFGATVMAGMGAYSKIEGFSFLPVTSFSMAVSTFVPQNIGAGQKKRAWVGARFSMIAAPLFAEVIGIAFFLAAPALISAFNADPAVVAAGNTRAHICSLFYCLCAFSHVASAVVRGAGRPVVPMAVMLICWCGVRVATFLTIGQVWHFLELACWIYPITWSMSTVVYLLYLRHIRKIGLIG